MANPTIKELTYDARDNLIVSIMKIIDQKLLDLNSSINTDEIWSDDVMDQMENIIEPYTTGYYENYN